MFSSKLIPLILAVSIVNAAIQVDLKKLDASIIRATVTNTGTSDAQLLKDPYSVLMPELPTNKFSFASEDGGASPTFHGVAVKWVPEIAAQGGNFVTIPAGQSLDFDHDISQAYASPGAATQYTVNLVQVTFTSTSGVLSFVPPALKNFGTPRPITKRLGRDPTLNKRADFVGCSSDQQMQIESAIAGAEVLAIAASGYLEPHVPDTPRYTTWFGTFDGDRASTVASHFERIANGRLLDTTYDCSTCTLEGVFAYVYPDRPNEIFLCPQFWPSPTFGTDSKAGTLVHESSHFTINGGTEDLAYGQENCMNLARENPDRAIQNADSHEYFAENTPFLP